MIVICDVNKCLKMRDWLKMLIQYSFFIMYKSHMCYTGQITRQRCWDLFCEEQSTDMLTKITVVTELCWFGWVYMNRAEKLHLCKSPISDTACKVEICATPDMETLRGIWTCSCSLAGVTLAGEATSHQFLSPLYLFFFFSRIPSL